MYSRVWVGKNLPDMFLPVRNGLKQRVPLTQLLSNFALEYAIRRLQVKQDGMYWFMLMMLIFWEEVYML
jgi:hypothetical protein